jgi:membrane dipeptidase
MLHLRNSVILRNSVVSRRAIFRTAALSLAAPLFGQSRAPYCARTVELVQRSTVIDMLGLLTLDYRKFSSWQTDPAQFRQADFVRLRNSGINIFHPAVGYTKGDIYTESLRDITRWNLFVSARPGQFLRVEGARDFDRAKATGKIGIVIGQQNSEHFRTVADVDRFYALGQRVSQLTYTGNRIGGGSSDARDSGLTKYGGEIVERMNQVGMAVDVSHCSDRTTLEAIEASSRPVLVTHSNCRHLVVCARCKPDEAIRKMAAKGGVMGVTMVRGFASEGGVTTIEAVLDHIDHIVRLVGVEHVGIGSDVDLDGRDTHTPRKYDLDGIDYSKKIFDLTEGLVRRNYSSADIELILGGNFKRALGAIWNG